MKKMNRPKRHFVFLRLCAVMLVMAMAIGFESTGGTVLRLKSITEPSRRLI